MISFTVFKYHIFLTFFHSTYLMTIKAGNEYLTDFVTVNSFGRDVVNMMALQVAHYWNGKGEVQIEESTPITVICLYRVNHLFKPYVNFSKVNKEEN